MLHWKYDLITALTLDNTVLILSFGFGFAAGVDLWERVTYAGVAERSQYAKHLYREKLTFTAADISTINEIH